VSACDAFIFLTPQYNWSFPASIKCAIDHLYQEWNGKPGLIISYSKRGGPKANAQLRQVLDGVRMAAWNGKIELKITGKDADDNSDRGVLADEAVEEWDKGGKKKEVLEKWEDLCRQARKFRSGKSEGLGIHGAAEKFFQLTRSI